MIDTKEIAKHLNEYRKSKWRVSPISGVGVYPSKYEFNLRLMEDYENIHLTLVTNSGVSLAILLKLSRSDLSVEYAKSYTLPSGLRLDASPIYILAKESEEGRSALNFNKFGVDTTKCEYALRLVEDIHYISLIIPTVVIGSLVRFTKSSNVLSLEPFVDSTIGAALDERGRLKVISGR